ncbi:MAG: hypothetical protein JO227_08030 [Acetobacteraceae bacterium]|nr:hypothetical protein [Acetobacteraceae bacterium]
MVDPEHVLIACPRCHAWPMSASLPKSRWSGPNEVSFRCARCGHQETVSTRKTSEAAQVEVQYRRAS